MFRLFEILTSQGTWQRAATTNGPYASQQAAEKAIKAVRYSMAIDLHVAEDKKKDDRTKRDFTHNLLHLAEPLR